ncbi:MAG TPA: hypothetical protein VHX40_08820, partial [Acidimicrobiales bacterium]|nr:hypothetical protein [Acidimicrobiales bacterium]
MSPGRAWAASVAATAGAWVRWVVTFGMLAATPARATTATTTARNRASANVIVPRASRASRGMKTTAAYRAENALWLRMPPVIAAARVTRTAKAR